MLELCIVMGIMVIMSLSTMQASLTEIRHAKARTLGIQLATFASGLGSYLNFYAGIDPTLSSSENEYAQYSPEDNSTQKGVNFLKSSSCSASETSDKGDVSIGFISNCSFLSHTNDTDLDEKTDYGHLSFTTTFTRTDSGLDDSPYALTSVTYLSELKGENDNAMKEESAIAALVAGGVQSSDTTSEVTAPYSVVYCVTEDTAKDTLNDVCNGHQDQIAVVVSTDASSAPYLRTDGGNMMLNRIKFNPDMEATRQAITNLTSIILTDDDSDTTTLAGGLTIGQTVTDPILQIDASETSLAKGHLLVEDSDGYLSVSNGWIHANKTIISDTQMESPIYLPYSDSDGTTDNTSNYKIVIDGDSEMSNVGVSKLYLGSTPTGTGRTNSSYPSIAPTSTNKGMKLTGDSVTMGGLSATTAALEGYVDVSNFNVLMSDGSYKTLATLLPRYTFLGATALTGTGYSYTLYKSPYVLLGCDSDDLKVIVTPQNAIIQSTYSNTSNYLSTTWSQLSAASGYSTRSVTSYSPLALTGQAAYGNLMTTVSNNGTYWTIKVYSNGASSSGNSYASNSSFLRGSAIASVYCYNDVNR